MKTTAEEEGEAELGERDRVGREGEGIWGTETNTYKTHKHSCVSEFVHKFSNLSCSLQGDGDAMLKGKGVVSGRFRGGLGPVSKCSRWYKRTQNVCEFWAGIVLLQLSVRFPIAFVVCIFSFKIGRIHYIVISHIKFCCDSTATIIEIASALCKTSSGNRRLSSKCFTSRLKSTRLLKSNARRERKRAQVREKMWANSKIYHWPTLSGNLFMPAAKLVPQCFVLYDG